MGTQEGHNQRRTDRIRTYLRAHHGMTVTAAISLAAITVATPFAVQAAVSDSQPSDSQASQQHKPNTDMPASRAIDQTPGKQQLQPSTENGSAANSAINSNKTNVTVNGETIPVPENGDLDQTIQNGNSRTDVHVNSQQHSNSDDNSSSNSSSVNVNINSESHSSSSQ